MSRVAGVIRLSLPMVEFLAIVGAAMVAGVVVGVVLCAVFRR